MAVENHVDTLVARSRVDTFGAGNDPLRIQQQGDDADGSMLENGGSQHTDCPTSHVDHLPTASGSGNPGIQSHKDPPLDVLEAASAAVAHLQHSTEALQQLFGALKLPGTGDVYAGHRGLIPQSPEEGRDRLVQLNVSGTIMEVPLSVLRQIPDSKLGHMFAPDARQDLLRDRKGNYYLPFDASAFFKIISALQARHVFGPSSSHLIRIPAAGSPQRNQQYSHYSGPQAYERNSSATSWTYLKDLIHHLGLQELLYANSQSLQRKTSNTTTNAFKAAAEAVSFLPAIATAVPPASPVASHSSQTSELGSGALPSVRNSSFSSSNGSSGQRDRPECNGSPCASLGQAIVGASVSGVAAHAAEQCIHGTPEAAASRRCSTEVMIPGAAEAAEVAGRVLSGLRLPVERQ